jgi:hypothetical protein
VFCVPIHNLRLVSLLNLGDHGSFVSVAHDGFCPVQVFSDARSAANTPNTSWVSFG